MAIDVSEAQQNLTRGSCTSNVLHQATSENGTSVLFVSPVRSSLLSENVVEVFKAEACRSTDRALSDVPNLLGLANVASLIHRLVRFEIPGSSL